MRRHTVRNQRGSSMLESAFIFGTFIFMMMGVMDFGRYLYMHQHLVERARNAARYGAMTVNDPTLNDKIVNMVLYNQPAAPTDGTPSMFNLRSNMVNVRYTCDNNAESPSYEVVVTISGYQYQMLAPYVAGTKVGKDIVATSPTEYVTNDAAPFCTAS